MSWRYVAWAWDKDLAAREKWLLFALAYHANDDDGGLCWPKVATLCRETGLAPRTIQRALEVLEGERLVYRWETVIDSEPRSNTYLLNVHDMGPTEWRHHCVATARLVKRGWVHRHNIDRAGNGHRPHPGEAGPLFGRVVDPPLQQEAVSASPTPPDGLHDGRGRRGATRGRHAYRRGCPGDAQNR